MSLSFAYVGRVQGLRAFLVDYTGYTNTKFVTSMLRIIEAEQAQMRVSREQGYCAVACHDDRMQVMVVAQSCHPVVHAIKRKECAPFMSDWMKCAGDISPLNLVWDVDIEDGLVTQEWVGDMDFTKVRGRAARAILSGKIMFFALDTREQ